MSRGVFPHVAFRDYALLDSGGGEKLERFGDVVVRRPDPQALWPRGIAESAWRAADLTFVPEATSGGRGGKWTDRKGQPGARALRDAGSHSAREVGSRAVPEAGSHSTREAGSRAVREAGSHSTQEAGSRAVREAGSRAVREARSRAIHDEWSVRCFDATLLARPTPFKHVGIFPEQAANWELVRAARAQLAGSGADAASPRLLNLFGYTGAASILALRAEYEVTHVDASRTSLAWARANLVASGLAEDAMRIVLDDALAFAQREARRGSKYHVILMDPPHYGRGPKGEKWQFEDAIAALVAAARDLAAERALVVLSTYAIGTSPLSLENLLADLGEGTLESGELALPEESSRARLLPAGFCARWSRGLHEIGSRGLRAIGSQGLREIGGGLHEGGRGRPEGGRRLPESGSQATGSRGPA